MSDSQSISNLLESQSFDDPRHYVKRDMLVVPDSNGGSYTSKRITVTTKDLKDYWLLHDEGYLVVPATVSANTTAWTSAASCALKNGIWQMLWSSKVNCGTTQISNLTAGINQMESIRAMIDADIDWQSSKGTFLNFSKDTSLTNEANPFTYYGTTGHTAANTTGTGSVFATTGDGVVTGTFATPVAGTIVSAINTTYNQGLADRLSFWNLTYNATSGGYAAGIYKLYCIIPLKYISPLFAHLNFPMKNFSFKIDIDLTTSAGSTGFNPFLCSNLSTDTAAPTFTVKHTDLQECRLYIPSVELSPAAERDAAARINAGLKREIRFLDHVQVPYTTMGSDATSISWEIASTIDAPRRVWIVGYPSGDPALSTKTSPATATMQLTQIQLNVDGAPYYSQPIQYDWEAYELLSKEFFGGRGYSDTQSGSLISYRDFQSRYRFYCLNISKHKIWEANPFKSVSLKLTAQRTEASAMDIYALVEVERVVQFDLTTGSVKVVDGKSS